MSLYRRSPIERQERRSQTERKQHTRNKNGAGNHKGPGPAYRQKLAESPGAKAHMLRISSHKVHRSTSVVPRTPRGQRPQNNSQRQAAQAERKREDEAKTSKESSNVRKKASIAANGIQDKVNHPFHLQAVLEPLQAILSEAVPYHPERF